MDLTLSLQNTPGAGLLWCGISGKQIGKLEPKAAVVIDFSLLATKPGLQVTIYCNISIRSAVLLESTGDALVFIEHFSEQISDMLHIVHLQCFAYRNPQSLMLFSIISYSI